VSASEGNPRNIFQGKRRRKKSHVRESCDLDPYTGGEWLKPNRLAREVISCSDSKKSESGSAEA